jgi:hypothetical protein
MKGMALITPLVGLALLVFGTDIALANYVYDPQKPVTVQMHRVADLQCSVTEYGPKFDFVNGFSTGGLVYGGGVSCLNGIGIKTVNIYVQVRSSTNPFQWFVKSGTLVTTGPRRQNPARLTVMKNAVRGHTYRIVATGTVTWNGHAVAATATSEAWTP